MGPYIYRLAARLGLSVKSKIIKLCFVQDFGVLTEEFFKIAASFLQFKDLKGLYIIEYKITHIRVWVEG